MTPEERIARAGRAQSYHDEFLGPVLREIEADYAEKMISVAASADPRAPEIIARLANGISVARQVKSRIETFIADGAVARADDDRKHAIEGMSPSDRRFLNIV